MRKTRIAIFIIIVGLAFSFPVNSLADLETPPPIQKELKLNAAIPPQSSDFQLEFSSSAQEATVGSNETITYTITYGSFLAFPTSLTLEAEWSLGTIAAKNLYAFDIVSYAPSSASRGYNETIPAIDLAKKKIVWKIENFPRNTKDKTVSFKLKTPSQYVTDQNVEFAVKAKLYTSKVSLPQKEIKLTYAPTPFIQTTPSVFAITNLAIRELKNTSASLLVRTTEPSSTTVFYGTTPDLEKSITDAFLSRQKIIVLSNLEPNTAYYLKVMVENEKGDTILTPELFSLTTPSASFISDIDQENMVIMAFGTVLKSRASIEKDAPILFPQKKSLDVFLPFTNNLPAQAFLRIVNAQVLGINNFEPLPFLEKIRLMETEPGIFSGKITSPSIDGNYDLMLETRDLDGNYAIGRLAQLRITEPLRILSSYERPIENARVLLEMYNPKQKMFEHFPAETFGLKNPAYSEPDGTVDMLFPAGRYKIKVAGLGYIPKEEVFDFSPSESQYYPKIILVKSAYSLKNNFLYYWGIFFDSLKFFNHSLDNLFSSYRFLQMSFLVGLGVFSVISLLLTAHHLKIKFGDLFIYLGKYWRTLIRYKIPAENLLIGFVESNAGLPIHGASIILVSSDRKKIAYKNITNFLGEFDLKIEKGKKYDLIITKKGFQTIKKRVASEELKKNHYLFQLKKETVLPQPIIVEFFLVITKACLHLFSVTLLFTVTILHLFYIKKFGVTKDLPIAFITFFNIILYFELVWREWKQKEKRLSRLQV